MGKIRTVALVSLAISLALPATLWAQGDPLTGGVAPGPARERPADGGAVTTALVPAGPSAPRPAATASASALTVNMGDDFYAPETVTVDVGGTVTWTNAGAVPHSATARDGSFDTGLLDPGASGSATFSRAGIISYVCSIHPNMRGAVRVESAGGRDGDSGGGGGTGGGGADAGTGTGVSTVPPAPVDTTATPTTPTPAPAPTATEPLPVSGLDSLGLAVLGTLLLDAGLLIWLACGIAPHRWLAAFGSAPPARRQI